MKKRLTLKVVYGGMLIALGIILPQAFHIFGPQAGQIFLPMHISVFLAGLLIGPYFGLAVGLVTPILSFAIMSMPGIPMLYFMLFELAAYALVSGFLSKKGVNVYISLPVAMLCGRVVYGLALIVAVNLFGLHLPFANVAAFFGGIVTGLPGIAIQFVIIPPIIFALKKGGLVLANDAIA